MSQQIPYIEHRNALQVTFSVWRALFLRDVLSRLVTERGAWFWMFFDPLTHIIFSMILLSTIRERHMVGVEFVVFMLVSIMAFKQFTHTAKSHGAVNSSKALFAYRQVHPVDTVLVKAVVEGMMSWFVTFILLSAAALFRFDVLPRDPFMVIFMCVTLWFLGLGMALTVSAIISVAPEAGKVFGIIFMPLYFLSSVLHPLSSVPLFIREILLYNPIVHGMELTRVAFFSSYQTVAGVNYSYLAWWTSSLLFLGLALQYVFAERLGAR